MRDFSLSRSQVDWGIPVPWDPSQTVYVWTEALHGYLTGAASSQAVPALPAALAVLQCTA